MIRAASQAGFVQEGRLRRSAWVNGDFADEVILGMLATNWVADGPRQHDDHGGITVDHGRPPGVPQETDRQLADDERPDGRSIPSTRRPARADRFRHPGVTRWRRRRQPHSSPADALGPNAYLWALLHDPSLVTGLSNPPVLPTTIAGFNGMNFLDSVNGYVPPDTDIAVGPAYVIETVNAQIQFYDKATGAAMLPNTPLSTFFGQPSESPFDPVVTYDDIAGRFIAPRQPSRAISCWPSPGIPTRSTASRPTTSTSARGAASRPITPRSAGTTTRS